MLSYKNTKTDVNINLHELGHVLKVLDDATAWDKNEIFGAGRLISEGQCYGWIHDMAVHPGLGIKGIGRNVGKEINNG